MPEIFVDGQCVVVATRGPGNLNLLSYQSNTGAPNIVAGTPTTNAGLTRFLISFSHTYERFAFFWDGAGEAVVTIGTALQNQPVGKSWKRASAISRVLPQSPPLTLQVSSPLRSTEPTKLPASSSPTKFRAIFQPLWSNFHSEVVPVILAQNGIVFMCGPVVIEECSAWGFKLSSSAPITIWYRGRRQTN